MRALFGAHLIWLICASAATTAAASTIINKDKQTHAVSIIERRGSENFKLLPAAKRENICPTGCFIRLNDDSDKQFQLEGNEIVAIENGLLYYVGGQSGDLLRPAVPVDARRQKQ